MSLEPHGWDLCDHVTSLLKSGLEFLSKINYWDRPWITLIKSVTKFVTFIYDYPMVWTKLTWNIVDDDKSVRLQIFSASTPPCRPRSHAKSSVSKYKFRNKLVRINFQWMAEYLFVSTHTIRLYWTDCIPVYRPAPASPLQKRLYRPYMFQFHHQDWNQCPLFDDLKPLINICLEGRQRVDRNLQIKWLTQEIHLYRLVFLNWIWDNKKSWVAKGLK